MVELSSIIASQCNLRSYSFKGKSGHLKNHPLAKKGNILDVSDKLHSFITNSNSTYYDDRVVQLLESTKTNGKTSEDVAKEWEKLLRKVRKNYIFSTQRLFSKLFKGNGRTWGETVRFRRRAVFYRLPQARAFACVGYHAAVGIHVFPNSQTASRWERCANSKFIRTVVLDRKLIECTQNQ